VRPEGRELYLQGPNHGPRLPPRTGGIRKPSQAASLLLVPRRPRTRPDYTKIITASCNQAGCSTHGFRCRAIPSEEQPLHRREPSLRA
jgi:hypothetical protein